MFSKVNLKEEEEMPSPFPPLLSPSKEMRLRKPSHACELSLSLLIVADLLRISPIFFFNKNRACLRVYIEEGMQTL